MSPQPPSDRSEVTAGFEAYAAAVQARPGLSLEDWLGERANLSPATAEALRELRDGMASLADELLAAGADNGAGAPPASRVGPYRLESLLGGGGMGRVWRARADGEGRTVALKTLQPGRYDEKALERFAREARVGGRLHHPGIVETLAHGVDDGVAWIALEFVPGSRTLADAIAETARAEDFDHTWYERAARWTAELAEALEAVHRAGLLHRDLKPSNVLLTPNGRPKLADFGLASARDEVTLTASGERIGTIAYMSPEQVRGEELDARTDVHGLGVVLYELLTLQRAFVGDSSQELAHTITAEEPPDPRTRRSGVPRDLAVIAGKALRKECAKRYASAHEMGADLARFLAREPIRAKPPSATERVQRWARRNPGKSSAGTAVALAFVVITALLAENLRTNEALGKERASLAVANQELLRKTAEAEESAAEAKRQQVRASEEKDRADRAAKEAVRVSEDVLSLFALRDLDGLISQVDKLWPCRSERLNEDEKGLQDAEALLAKLPAYEGKLAELRARARPFSEDELAVLRAQHPSLPRLQDVQHRLAYLRARRAAMDAPPLVDPTPAEVGLDFSQLPDDANGLHTLAWPLVQPERMEFGGEARALLLARKALTLAQDPGERAAIRDTVAWALFGLGRCDDALAEAERAVEDAPQHRRAEFQDYEAVLRAAVEADTSSEGQARAEQEIVELQEEEVRLEKEVSTPPPTSWAFDKTEDVWWYTQLGNLIENLRALADPRSGLLSDGVSPEHGWCIRRRLEFAATCAERSTQGDAGTRWTEVCRAIQDRTECPQYGGMRLSPQVGLVPLGRDPQSGLWEFADLQTGEPPERGADGALRLREDSGLVFVLLPGGTFSMGAQAADRAKPNFDPFASNNEEPVQAVTLAPFFLSKYEMTQGQWQRFTGTNPSSYNPKTRFGGRQTTLLHPVEQITWVRANAVLQRLGFALPTEAQWEYGARGGTHTVWFTGDEPESLADEANLADAFCHENGGPIGWIYEDWLDDGFAVHAPVGSLRPNAFGIHEVLGNVYEWCRDRFDFYSRNLPAHGDGERRVKDPSAPRVIRGGCFSDTKESLRSAYRYYGADEFAGDSQGLRPARAVTP